MRQSHSIPVVHIVSMTWFSFLLAAAPLVAESSNEGVNLTNQTTIHFSAIEEARTVVGTRDAFLTSLSSFDRKVRLQIDRDVSDAELIEFISKEILSWDPDARGKVIRSIDRVRPKLSSFNLPLPAKVSLILTTGKEESNAAYTRGSSIFFPRERIMGMNDDQLDRIFLHELFHVLSRNAPELRGRLYRIIGFEVCESIKLPENLINLKLTNPDAPLIDCHIKLDNGDHSINVAPVLYASSSNYDVVKKPSLFKYLEFRLMKLKKIDDRWHPEMKDGKAELIVPSSIPAYARQIGANTKYIIHPDEILADNFVLFVMKNENLPSPWVIDQMKEVINSTKPLP